MYTEAAGNATCVIKPMNNRQARKSDGLSQNLKELK
jgi:hypothetical protein